MKYAVCALILVLQAIAAGAEDKAATAPPTVALSHPAGATSAAGDISAAPPVSASLTLPAAPEPATAVTLARPRVESAHRFFDFRNSTGLSLMAAGLTADALSTQKGLGLQGFHEMNPIARPFVQTRAGAGLYSAGSFALMGGGMYLAHKTHHHRVERILPFAIAGWEGFLAVRNYHLISSSTNH